MKDLMVNIVLTGLIAGGVYLIVAGKIQHGTSESLAESIAKKESQTSREQALLAQVKQLSSEVDSLKEEALNLKKALSTSDKNLTTEDQGIIKLTHSFETMSERCNNFLAQRKQWDKERARMKSASTRLSADNRDLTYRLMAISETNKELTTQLSLAKLFEKDNISIARLDKNDQPNAQASKIKKIKVSMSLPSVMKSPAFKIYDSSGKMLSDKSGSFTSNFSNEVNSFGDKATRMELTYLLSEQVEPGSYRLDIDNEGKHVANLFMAFR
jgi:hypothetical protein